MPAARVPRLTPGSKGCLGMVILIIGLPIGIALACLHYATGS
ncbi:hypothetical protein J2X58_003034 [Luteibacter sp. 3190]|nr:hypothetical protein [Luteibacter sp. 3190]